jgi:hypothetical protein
MNNSASSSHGSKIRHAMTQWLVPLYKWLGVSYPIASHVVMFLLGGILLGGMWYLTGREYRDSLERNKPTAGDTHPHETARAALQDAPVKPPIKKAAPKLPVSLQAISDEQRFALKKELSGLSGNSVRIVLIGEDSNAEILNMELLDVFSAWQVSNPRIGQGPPVHGTPYLASTDISSQLVRQVYGIFSRYGVDIHLVPGAYMGPTSMGAPEGIVIVIK